MSNPVHKNREKFNKPSTHKDRKKEHKKGYYKHKDNTQVPQPENNKLGF
jgi:hypothetical protein